MSERSTISDELRADWIRTVLVVVGSEPQRTAFVRGYNGDELPPYASQQMRKNYALGQRVTAVLNPKRTPVADGEGR